MINKAIEFAVQAHKNQHRKGSNKPFILHPLEALTIVSRITSDEEIMTAAVLHDTIEDANVTYEQIKNEFGKRVADIVNAESEDKSKSWEERKSHTLNTLKNESKEAKIVALGDKLANMRSMAKDYAELGEALWQRFNVKDKSKQGWYYKGIVNALDEFNATPEWQELKHLTDKVFG